MEAVLYRYRAGVPWRDLPERFGDFRVVHTRFTVGPSAGVWQQVLAPLAANADNEYAISDATSRDPTSLGRGPAKGDQAIGRSKGGLSTKIHAVVDALGNPLRLHLTAGQRCDLAVIPPRAKRLQPRTYDQELYTARHLIENFFAAVHFAAVCIWLV